MMIIDWKTSRIGTIWETKAYPKGEYYNRPWKNKMGRCELDLNSSG